MEKPTIKKGEDKRIKCWHVKYKDGGGHYFKYDIFDLHETVNGKKLIVKRRSDSRTEAVFFQDALVGWMIIYKEL